MVPEPLEEWKMRQLCFAKPDGEDEVSPTLSIGQNRCCRCGILIPA